MAVKYDKQTAAKQAKRVLDQSRFAAATHAKARDDFYESIRKAAAFGNTRSQISEAVGLSRTRVQQIIKGYNR